jgi:mannose-6-phosphate isomerase-like protein (cupin superfamily)
MAPRVTPPQPEYLIAFNNGDCLIEYWTPRDADDQKTHDRDEVYVLTGGESDFILGDEQRAVKSGDIIFVPAGMPRCFINFSNDLAMWIVFFAKRHKGCDPRP